MNGTNAHMKLTANKKLADNASEKPSLSVSESLTIQALNQNMLKGNDNPQQADSEFRGEAILQLGGHAESNVTRSSLYNTIHLIGIAASVLWISYCSFFFISAGMTFTPQAIGGALTSVFAPVALFWLAFSHFARKSDVEFYAKGLRREMEGLLFPSKQHALKVNKDIQHLCEQVADMNTNSRATLKSIQRARQGLRSEIRDFSSIASKAEFHIDRLGDVLEARKKGLLESIEQIEMSENILKDHADNSLDAWRLAEQEILSLSQGLEQKLYTGTENITQAADRAHEKVKDIGATMDDTYVAMKDSVNEFGSRLDDMSLDFDSHVDTLSNAADRVSGETQKLGENIRGEIDSLEHMTIQAIEAMAESSTSIEAQRRDLHNGVKDLTAEADSLSVRIADAAEKMDESVQLAAQNSKDAEERLKTQANRIGDLSRDLDEKSSSLEKSGDLIASQLGDAMAIAISGSEKLRTSVRRIAEEMKDVSEDTELKSKELLDDIITRFDNVHDHSAHNIGKLRQATRDFDEIIVKMDKSVASHDDKVEKTINSLNTKVVSIETVMNDFEVKVENLIESFDEPIQSVESAGQDLEIKQENIVKILEDRTIDMQEAANRAEEQTLSIRETLSSQVSALSALSGELSGRASGLEDQIRVQREEIQDHTQNILEQITSHNDNVGDYIVKLEKAGQIIDGGVGRFDSSLEQYLETITQKTEKTNSELFKLENDYLDHWGKIESAAAKSAKVLSKSVDSLKTSSLESVPYYDEMLERIDRTDKRFNEVRNNIIESGEDIIDRIGSLNERVEQAASDIEKVVQDANVQIRTQEGSLRDAGSVLEESSDKAALRLKDMRDQIKTQGQSIQLLSDKVETRVDALNDTIGSQYIKLSESIGKSVTQLSDAAQRFETVAGKVSDSAETESNKIALASSKVNAALESLRAVSKDCVSDNEAAADDLKERTRLLVKSTKDSRDAMAKAGDSFILRAKEFEEYIKASLSTTKDYVSELKTQASAVAEASDEGADQIRKSVSDIKGQVDQVSTSAQGISKKIKDAGVSLEGEADKLSIKARRAVSASETAASELARQSSNLSKSVRDTESALERMSLLRQEAQQEAFMDSAKFIVEGLHSLSVDIARQATDIDDKTWKAFKKGDLSAFTRKLAEIDFTRNSDKLKAKYENDNEFRGYVLRFMRQFEELLEQSYKTTHAEMLCTAFLSSDIGKLYQKMGLISGQKNK